MPHVHEAIAQAWLDAFNTGDVPKLVALYAEECTHTSPKIRALHPETGGKLVGRAALALCIQQRVGRRDDGVLAKDRGECVQFALGVSGVGKGNNVFSLRVAVDHEFDAPGGANGDRFQAHIGRWQAGNARWNFVDQISDQAAGFSLA